MTTNLSSFKLRLPWMEASRRLSGDTPCGYTSNLCHALKSACFGQVGGRCDGSDANSGHGVGCARILLQKEKRWWQGRGDYQAGFHHS